MFCITCLRSTTACLSLYCRTDFPVSSSVALSDQKVKKNNQFLQSVFLRGVAYEQDL